MNDRPDPLTDMLAFLTKPAWFTAVFWLLLIASGAIRRNDRAAIRAPDCCG